MDIDNEGKDVDQKNFRGIIGSLLYLTASRPDISFAIGVCVRFQSKPKESHLSTTKKILRYLKGTQSVGLWYRKGGSFDLVGYSDADFAGWRIDRKKHLRNLPVPRGKNCMSTGKGKEKTDKECEEQKPTNLKAAQISENQPNETEIFHDPLENEENKDALNRMLASSQYLQNLLHDPTEHESFHFIGTHVGYTAVDSVLERSESYDYSPSSTPPKFSSPLRSTASSKKKTN
ncbi:PREDICTED: uncharacterized protein LOC109155205 [Ipomoea nil]|uniref:uncharacterized protein LOC109155205 n=1 Tax=Ipomoea nil TaxID=35883 RepID=UPI000901C615|nr:PREDICTED: uncharacterized protein LOC109155205 [Ipomoea nil]